MQGLKEDGLIACYQDYLDLPLVVLGDWRMVQHGRLLKHERESNRAAGGNNRSRARSMR